MEAFSLAHALAIFAAYCSADWLFTLYTIAIVERRKLRAANVGVGIYLLGAFGTLSYVSDWRYIIPMCIGGWVGTYLSVWYEQRKDRKASARLTSNARLVRSDP